MNKLLLFIQNSILKLKDIVHIQILEIPFRYLNKDVF